jgi:hypothetical protein
MLAAGHVVVPSNARQNDPIVAPDLPGSTLGRLLTWTDFDGDTTCDAALIWVDPDLVSAEINGLGVPTGVNTNPKPGDEVRLSPDPGGTGDVRTTKISEVGADIVVDVTGPDWSTTVTYRKQILCSPMVSHGGDSGAIVLDADDRVIGMIVAGGAGDTARDPGVTIVTPIAALLNNIDWQGTLNLVTQIPADAVPPPAIPTAPNGVASNVNLDALNAAQQAIAQMIVSSFATAGFGIFQQVAALASAKAESNLDPLAHSPPPEDSVGLFQLNRAPTGVGAGHEVAELEDAATNIAITIAHVRSISSFVQAASLDAAVDAFVRFFERPKNPNAAVVARQLIAKGFMRS